MTPEISKNTEYLKDSIPENVVSRNVIDNSDRPFSRQEYHKQLAERFALGKLSYEGLKEMWKDETPLSVLDDLNQGYPEGTSPETIVEDFMRGKITSYKIYNELFRKALNHRFSRTPLEKFIDSTEKKKNQMVDRVVGFVKKLGR